jgi:hypothetical protein
VNGTRAARPATSNCVRLHHLGLALVAAVSLATSGCGSDGTTAPARTYTVDLRIQDDADRYRYVAVGDVPTFQVGDDVTFRVDNTGTLDHDLQVVGPDGRTIATAPAVRPGGTLDLEVLLDEPGVYQLNCLVDDHLTRHRMQTLIEVVEPAT